MDHKTTYPPDGTRAFKKSLVLSFKDFGMTLVVSLLTEMIDPSRPCCTAQWIIAVTCYLVMSPWAQRYCLSPTVKVCLSGICFAQWGLLSCLEKLLIKMEIELSKVNYWVPWLSLDSLPILDVIITGGGEGSYCGHPPETIHYLAEKEVVFADKAILNLK